MLKDIKIIVCWIVRFGRILMYLNVTLWTLNMVCRKFKIYIPAFLHVAMKPFRIWTKWMQNPHLHDIVNIFLKFQSSIRIHYKVTGLQSLAKLYRTRFLLKNGPYIQCVTKIILTAKLFGVGSSNFGFVHLDNWATHLKNLNKIRRRSAWGFLKICSLDVE